MLRKAVSNLNFALDLEEDKAWSEKTIQAFSAYYDVLKNYKQIDVNELYSHLEYIDDLVYYLSPLSRQAMNQELLALKAAQDAAYKDHTDGEYSHLGSGGGISSRAEFDASNQARYDNEYQKIINSYPNAEHTSDMLRLLNARLIRQIKNHIGNEKFNLNQAKFQDVVKRLANSNIQPLAQIASDLLNGVNAAVKKPAITRNDKYKLENILDAASQLIETMREKQDNPFDLKSNSHFFEKLHAYENAVSNISGMNRDTRRMVLGAALALAGFALMAASITVAVLTFGVSTPLSLAAAAVSTELMIAGAVTMGVTAVAGLSLGVANGIFADRARKGVLTCLAENFAVEVRAIKGCK